jgi:hypothetical protein
MKTNKQAICNEEVFRTVAEELGLDVKVVREIYGVQSLFTKKTMESNTFDGVRHPYFGVFKVKPKLVQISSHMRGLKKEAQKIFKEALKNGEIYGNGEYKKT